MPKQVTKDMTVAFPKLNLSFELDRVAFYFSNYPVYWYGVIIAIGLVMGIITATYTAKRLGSDSDIPLDLAIFCGPVAVVFARLYYVIFRLDYYLENPMDIFNLRAGGIAIYGAVIGAVISAFIYSRVKKYPCLRVFDIGAVGLITGQMIGRWGNFVNQEAFGGNTSLPWGMISEGTKEYLSGLKLAGERVNPELPVHPTFLYESLWCLAVLIVLIFLVRRHKFDGQIFFAYASLYGLGRFWIEGLRTDSLMFGPLRISQLVALLCIIVFGALYLRGIKSSGVADTENSD